MQYLEMLIAFSGVILLASLMVTLITQLVVAAANLRGKNLVWGLKLLMNNIVQQEGETVDTLLQKIVDYPLVARTYRLFKLEITRTAQVIRREEFIQLLEKYDIEYDERYVWD